MQTEQFLCWNGMTDKQRRINIILTFSDIKYVYNPIKSVLNVSIHEHLKLVMTLFGIPKSYSPNLNRMMFFRASMLWGLLEKTLSKIPV